MPSFLLKKTSRTSFNVAFWVFYVKKHPILFVRVLFRLSKVGIKCALFRLPVALKWWAHHRLQSLGQRNGNEPSHDETFPHRTYIEMKKLSRILERGLLVSLSPLFMMQMYALLSKLPNKSAIILCIIAIFLYSPYLSLFISSSIAIFFALIFWFSSFSSEITMSLFTFKKTLCEELEINTSIPCDIINVRKETLCDNVRNDIF